MFLVNDFLSALLCLITLMAQLVAKGLVLFAQVLIDGAGLVIAGIVAVSPSMPNWPVSGQDWSWLNWFLPVSGLISVFGTGVTLALGFLAYRIVLNWLKAV